MMNIRKLTPKDHQIAGIASLLGATGLYSLWGVLSRIIGFTLPLLYQSGMRALIASLIAFFLLFQLKQWKHMRRKDFVWVLLRSICGSISAVAFFVAINFIKIGTVYFMFYGGLTIGGYVIGAVLFKERLTKIKVAALLVSLAGLLLIYSLNVNIRDVFYLVLSLSAGVFTAVWNTFSKKVSQTYSSLQLTFLDNLLGGFMILAVSLIAREIWVMPVVSAAWGANLLLAIFYVLTGQLVIYGFRYLDAQVGSLVMLIEVLFGIILGFIFYQETISLLAVFGGILIVLGVVLPESRVLKRFLFR